MVRTVSRERLKLCESSFWASVGSPSISSQISEPSLLSFWLRSLGERPDCSSPFCHTRRCCRTLCARFHRVYTHRPGEFPLDTVHHHTTMRIHHRASAV